MCSSTAVHRAPVALADLDEVLPSIDPEVAVDVRPRHVHVGLVRARDPVHAAPHGWIGEDRDLRAEPLGTDEPLGEPVPGEVLVLEAAHPFGEVQPRELLLPHLAIAGKQHRDGATLDVEEDALQRGRGGHAHLFDHQVDRHRARRLDLRERLELSGSARLGSARRRGFGIREVVVVLAPHEQVLTDVGEGHELVVHPAADRPGIGLDGHDVQAQSVEHALVGLVHHAVGLAQPVLVPIERVRVLHQELAPAQQPVAGTPLVPILPLHLVHVDGEVLVRRELLLDEGSNDLLLGRPQQELPAVAVLQPEELVPVGVPPSGLLPGLRRQHDRHAELLRPRRVHLLAHDPLDLRHRAEPERHRRVDPGGHLADEGGAEQQSMRRDVGLRRIVPERAREEPGYPHRTRIPADLRAPGGYVSSTEAITCRQRPVLATPPSSKG